jgi:hypothetical protein
MDLIDKLKKIGERFEKLKDQVQTISERYEFC